MWVPVYSYKLRNKAGRIEQKMFQLREFRLYECPISFISARSAQLVKLWQKAERNKTTLSELLGSDEAWIEDVEEALADAQETVKDAYERDKERRIAL